MKNKDIIECFFSLFLLISIEKKNRRHSPIGSSSGNDSSSKVKRLLLLCRCSLLLFKCHSLSIPIFIWSAYIHLIHFSQAKPPNKQQAITCLSRLTVINILISIDDMITVNNNFAHKLVWCDPNGKQKLIHISQALHIWAVERARDWDKNTHTIFFFGKSTQPLLAVHDISHRIFQWSSVVVTSKHI